MSARPGFMSFLLEAMRFVKYAQHDQNIANADGATVRADINNALAALFGLSSGAAAPSTTIAYMLWADTTTGLLKIRNAANSAWVTVGTLASTNLGLLALSGGTMTGDLLFTDATYDIGKSGATRPRDGFFSRNVAIGGTLGVSGVLTGSVPDNRLGTGNRVTNLDGGVALHVVGVAAGMWALGVSNTNANPASIYCYHSTDSNDTGNVIRFDGGASMRFGVDRNGGIRNFSANNVNLSDERVKPTLERLREAPGLLEQLSDALEAIEFVRYKYEDQTHDDWNYGYTAQDVREKFAAIAPELVDRWETLTEVQETREVEREVREIVMVDGRAVLKLVKRRVLEAVVDEHPIYDESGRPVMVLAKDRVVENGKEVAPAVWAPAVHAVPRMRQLEERELLAVYSEDLKNISMAVLGHTLRRVRALEAAAA